MEPIQVVSESFETFQEAATAEKFWIKLFKSLHCPLVNKTSGGEGVPDYVPTEATKKKISENTKAAMSCPEIRRKISEAKKGHASSRLGKKHSEEAKQKISKAHKGKIPAIAATGHTEECKKRMSEIAKASFAKGERKTRAGIAHSDDVKQRLREAHGTQIQDQFGNTYWSINQAFQATGISRAYIRQVLQNEKEEHKGYRFTYVARA